MMRARACRRWPCASPRSAGRRTPAAATMSQSGTRPVSVQAPGAAISTWPCSSALATLQVGEQLAAVEHLALDLAARGLLELAEVIDGSRRCADATARCRASSAASAVPRRARGAGWRNCPGWRGMRARGHAVKCHAAWAYPPGCWCWAAICTAPAGGVKGAWARLDPVLSLWWCRVRDLNPRPSVYKTAALPLC